mmetsp:Transcript_91152/g.284057  ORF Transcript_91152/g.284057 Transcript_91152/m.284057 type:complete len:159 (-) Transcript_91152:448-924(-)
MYVWLPGAAIGPIGYRNYFGSAALRAHSRLGRGGRGHIYYAGALSVVGGFSGHAIVGPIGGTCLTGPAALRARLLSDRGDTGRTVLAYVHGAGGLQYVLTCCRTFWDVARAQPRPARAHAVGEGPSCSALPRALPRRLPLHQVLPALRLPLRGPAPAV